MRSRLVQTAVFICVFGLFLGYCEWWKARTRPIENARAYSPPDCGAYIISGAGDETFDGVYVPVTPCEAFPCFMKEAPRRYLWRSPDRWHLSTEPGTMADGYMSERDTPLTGDWCVDGAPKPPPHVSETPEAAGQGFRAPRVTVPESPPESCPERPDGSPATSPD